MQDNSHYQNRERDQRGEDHDVWRIAGGIGHGVTCRAWIFQSEELRILLRPNQFGSDPVIGLFPTDYSRPLSFLRSIYRQLAVRNGYKFASARGRMGAKDSVPPKPVFMNVKIFLFAAASLLDTALLYAGGQPNSADFRQVAATVGRLLEQGHYSRWKLGPEM